MLKRSREDGNNMARKPLIAGNWKMNKGTVAEAESLVSDLLKALPQTDGVAAVDIAICVPFTVLHTVNAALGGASRIALGAQDVFWKSAGAYTGRISAPFLADAGVTYVLVGHSETRGRFGVPEPDFNEAILRHFGDTDAVVNRKIHAALDAGLIPVVCVGETLTERESGSAEAVVRLQVEESLTRVSAEQVAGLVFAYEPVWAIGTGKTCSGEEADRICGVIRSTIHALYSPEVAEAVRIQYGGSMKPDNAADLLSYPNIDGGLIGGASLKAADFAAIVAAAHH
jgi:triosephosphate isomerase